MMTTIQYYKFSDNRQHDYINFIAHNHSKIQTPCKCCRYQCNTWELPLPTFIIIYTRLSSNRHNNISIIAIIQAETKSKYT